MNTALDLDFGVEYKVTVLNQKTRAIVHESDWGHNLILNNTGELCSKGFASSPVPRLGSDGSTVQATDTGVKAPFSDLLMLSTIHNPAGTKYVQLAPNKATITWIYAYTLINQSSQPKTVREIGIDGFSRALLKDSKGSLPTVELAPYDIIVIDLRYVLNMNLAKQQGTVVDPSGATVVSFDIDYTITPPADIATASWWKLFAPQKVLTFKSNGGSTYAPTNKTLVTTFGSREVLHKYALMTSTGFVWTSLVYTFLSNAPIIEAKFSKPITVPANQIFELTINPKW